MKKGKHWERNTWENDVLKPLPCGEGGKLNNTGLNLVSRSITDWKEVGTWQPRDHRENRRRASRECKQAKIWLTRTIVSSKATGQPQRSFSDRAAKPSCPTAWTLGKWCIVVPLFWAQQTEVWGPKGWYGRFGGPYLKLETVHSHPSLDIGGLWDYN